MSPSVRAARWATAYAPASVSNLAAGFDLLGHAVPAAGDRVSVRRIAEPTVRIASVTGTSSPLPTEAAANTATAGLLALRAELGLAWGFEVEIHKGIPLSSGMGGSAASAVAALVAADALLPAPLGAAELLRYALVGETVASGAPHADNLAPSLLGGLVLVRSVEPPDVVRLPVPAHLCCVLVHPHLRLDTRTARAALPAAIPLRTHVEQSANLAGLIAGCFTGDLALIGRSLRDVVAEPHRAGLIPGFAAEQRAALDAGALGCSISGAGPSVFAWVAETDTAHQVRDRMVAAFAAGGTGADGWVSAVDSPGAHVVAAE